MKMITGDKLSLDSCFVGLWTASHHTQTPSHTITRHPPIILKNGWASHSRCVECRSLCIYISISAKSSEASFNGFCASGEQSLQVKVCWWLVRCLCSWLVDEKSNHYWVRFFAAVRPPVIYSIAAFKNPP